MKRISVGITALALCGCTTADFARMMGREDRIEVVLVSDDQAHSLRDVRVSVLGWVSSFPLSYPTKLIDGRTDDSGTCEIIVRAHSAYRILVGDTWGQSSSFIGEVEVERRDVLRQRIIEIPVKWREGPYLAPWEREAEPGATDNPDDAQRLRENH